MTRLSELIRVAQTGDSDAVDSIIVQFSPVIRQECLHFRLAQTPDLSQSDLFQEVLLRVWTKFHQFTGEPSNRDPLETDLCTRDQNGQSEPGNGEPGNDGELCEDDGERRLRAAFDSWIRRSAKSALSNLLRNRNTKKRHPGRAIQSFDEMFPSYHQPDEAPGVSSIVVQDEEAERLREAMVCCLDDRTREIVLRYIVEGHTFGEIAVDLCLSYEQVRYAFHKAQAELTQWINSNQNHD